MGRELSSGDVITFARVRCCLIENNRLFGSGAVYRRLQHRLKGHLL